MDSSPFVVGVAEDEGMDPASLEPQIEAALHLLADLKARLPHTELKLLIDGGGRVGAALALAAKPRGISVVEASPSSHADLAGVLVARSSLLIALWDGRKRAPAGEQAPPRPRARVGGSTDSLVQAAAGSLARADPGRSGGAADVVGRFLGMRLIPDLNDPAALMGHDPADAGQRHDHSDLLEHLVFWIKTPAPGEATPALRAPCYLSSSGGEVLEAHEAMPASLPRLLEELDEYNREYASFIGAGYTPRAPSLMLDLPELAESDASALRAIDRQYVKADALAGHMQWRSDRLFNLFGIMAFVMGLVYLIYDKIVESRGLLLAYLCILFGSLCAYYWLNEQRWLAKHLSYRALAETLRVRFYLALAGLDHHKLANELIALAGVHRFRGFGLIGPVLDTLEPMPPDESHPAAEAHSTRSRFIEQAWVEAQYKYFVRKVARMELGTRRVKRIKTVMFAVALADILAMFIFGDALHQVSSSTGLPIKNLMTFCSGFLAVFLGVWELGQNKMATRELLWQYRNQLAQFARARKRLRHLKNRHSRAELLIDLGANSLMETYLWAIHRYHREHSPPGAH